jgi:hypothetical protein
MIVGDGNAMISEDHKAPVFLKEHFEDSEHHTKFQLLKLYLHPWRIDRYILSQGEVLL